MVQVAGSRSRRMDAGHGEVERAHADHDPFGRSRQPLTADVRQAAVLFAIDPSGLGGVCLRAAAGPLRDRWLELLRNLLPGDAQLRRVPLHISDDALLGGLDLTATLQAGRPVFQRGVLRAAAGGVLVLAMAERLPASTSAHVAAALDASAVDASAVDAAASDLPAVDLPATDTSAIDAAADRRAAAGGVGVVALDEGIGPDERVPARLMDRLAFHLAPDAGPRCAGSEAGSRAGADGNAACDADWGADRRAAAGDAPADAPRDPPGAAPAADTRERVLEARRRLPNVRVDGKFIEALCAAALALGIASIRAPLLAVRAARASAALDGREAVNEHDAATAARLVLASRATLLPTAPPPDDETASEGDDDPAAVNPVAEGPDDPATPEDSSPADSSPPGAAGPDATSPDAPALEAGSPSRPPPDLPAEQAGHGPERVPEDAAVDDVILQAVLAAIPPDLLRSLNNQPDAARSPATSGRAGALRGGGRRGRPSGVRRGDPGGNARLNLIATLVAAAPWQGLRGRDVRASGDARVHIRREDFRVTHFKQRSETTAVFVVDASGSAALHRLAETKGAVELLLADCYVRRDSVAVLAFRGRGAELLLPPTRSLVRAKRSLAQLPGGGGTPLAAGIDAAGLLADTIRRRGATPLIVLLTDGRANIGRDGLPGRAAACADATDAACRLRSAGFSALLVDTSPQPQDPARLLAKSMGARYLPLPHAGAPILSQAVRGAAREVPFGQSSRADEQR